MIRPDPNLEMLERVAEALGSLRERVVFVGGCATGILITDPAAAPIRATKDVDVIVEVLSRAEYRGIEKDLESKGFRRDQAEGAPLCRWVVAGCRVDVMPTREDLLGFSNPWYPEAIHEAMVHVLPGGLRIKVVAPAQFIATKLQAFLGRGKGDFLGSHDLEDVVAVLDGRPEVIQELKSASSDLRAFVSRTLKSLLADDRFQEALQGHLPPDPASQARLPELQARILSLSMGE